MDKQRLRTNFFNVFSSCFKFHCVPFFVPQKVVVTKKHRDLSIFFFELAD